MILFDFGEEVLREFHMRNVPVALDIAFAKESGRIFFILRMDTNPTSLYGPAQVEVRVSELSAAAQAGQLTFDRSCARCHGPHARGSATGPPLVHPTYRRAHHADVAFEFAVERGARAHHWRFEDMPPQPTVTAAEISQVTRYVRELQAANGID